MNDSEINLIIHNLRSHKENIEGKQQLPKTIEDSADKVQYIIDKLQSYMEVKD